MRLLHVDGGRTWGGGQNQVRLLMHGLTAHGITQKCICPANGALAGRLSAEGLPVRGVTWRRGFDLNVLRRLAFEMTDVDLVHAHDTHAFQLSLLAALVTGVPVIASRRTRYRTRPFTWNRADRVIAVSETVRAHIVKSGVDERRVVTIHSGIDLAELAALQPGSPSLRERLGLSAQAFVAGTVGSLNEGKQHELIVEAAAFAKRDVTWVIVGDGPREPLLRQRIADRGVSDQVHLAGLLPDARRYLREMNVFVFPSRGEALGTSLLDAMALGVPVVAADDAGPAEVLGPVHARTGNSLVTPLDARALRQAVERFRTDADLRERAARAQLERVRDFAIEHTVARTLAVYAAVLDG